MLADKPRQRLSAQQVLAHPWLKLDGSTPARVIDASVQQRMSRLVDARWAGSRRGWRHGAGGAGGHGVVSRAVRRCVQSGGGADLHPCRGRPKRCCPAICIVWLQALQRLCSRHDGVPPPRRPCGRSALLRGRPGSARTGPRTGCQALGAQQPAGKWGGGGRSRPCGCCGGWAGPGKRTPGHHLPTTGALSCTGCAQAGAGRHEHATPSPPTAGVQAWREAQVGAQQCGLGGDSHHAAHWAVRPANQACTSPCPSPHHAASSRALSISPVTLQLLEAAEREAALPQLQSLGSVGEGTLQLHGGWRPLESCTSDEAGMLAGSLLQEAHLAAGRKASLAGCAGLLAACRQQRRMLAHSMRTQQAVTRGSGGTHTANSNMNHLHALLPVQAPGPPSRCTRCSSGQGVGAGSHHSCGCVWPCATRLEHEQHDG